MPLTVVIATPLEPASLARLRAAAPDVAFVEAPDRDALVRGIGEADVLFGGRPDAGLLDAAPRLRWIQAFSAGVNHLPLPEIAQRKLLLTNASGAHGAPIAENLLAMMLAFAARLPQLMAAKQERRWVQDAEGKAKFELAGQTLLIVGLGAIGGELAVRAGALGMRVWGSRRRALHPPAGVERVVPADEVDETLGEADHVALCLPLTAETDGYLDAGRIRRMKRGGYVYNIGRGRSIEREALLAALADGRLAGAGLDVTDPEPLPADDPLWSLPNVILTQHTSGWSPQVERRVVDIFLQNLQLYRDARPLRNLVDLAAGY